MSKDKRPDPRPRKNAALWQAYQWWFELVEMRKRHTQRINSVKRGKSNMDAQFERDMMEHIELDRLVDETKQIMINYGKATGQVWDWLTGIRGLGAGSLAAQLLAQVDYPAPFPGSYPGHCATISKLWRYAGWAVVDGQIDRPTKGKTLPYNKKLKSVIWNIVDQFIRQQTPVYAELYYEEKERQRRLHPVPICKKCGGEGVQKGQQWKCSQCGATAASGEINFTPHHIDLRAKRKVAKIFLSHLWLVWRQAEGIPVSDPYVANMEGHNHIVPPVNWEPA